MQSKWYWIHPRRNCCWRKINSHFWYFELLRRSIDSKPIIDFYFSNGFNAHRFNFFAYQIHVTIGYFWNSRSGPHCCMFIFFMYVCWNEPSSSGRLCILPIQRVMQIWVAYMLSPARRGIDHPSRMQISKTGIRVSHERVIFKKTNIFTCIISKKYLHTATHAGSRILVGQLCHLTHLVRALLKKVHLTVGQQTRDSFRVRLLLSMGSRLEHTPSVYRHHLPRHRSFPKHFFNC